jgi:polysaccharide biosynthesis transport protein
MSRIVRLFVCPRGKQFLKEIYHQFDYIIIDSSPVLVADDTTSPAPKIDATLLVVRLSYTSARLTKKAFELLYSRQVNVPGVILNYVDTSLPEYYYYEYSEYCNRPVVASESQATAQRHPTSQAQSS